MAITRAQIARQLYDNGGEVLGPLDEDDLTNQLSPGTIGRGLAFVLSGGLTSGPALAKEILKQKVMDKIIKKSGDIIRPKVQTELMQQDNRTRRIGGYQSDFAQDSGFMEGRGTSAEMGSFADGGRIGFRVGTGEGKDTSGRDYGGSVSGGVDRPGGGNEPSGPPTNVGGGGVTTLTSKKDVPTPNVNISKFNVKDLINLGLVDEEQDTMKVAGLNQEQVDYLNQVGKKVSNVDVTGDFFTYDSPTNVKSQLEKLNPESESGIFGKEFDPDKIVAGDPNTYATEKDVQDYIKSAFPNLTTGGRKVGLAEGGMPYEGGIMDLESARQMYGLGKLVKKVTRSVKKIAKSPIGKAAILGAAGFYAGGGNLFGLQRAGMSGFKFANLPGAALFAKSTPVKLAAGVPDRLAFNAARTAAGTSSGGLGIGTLIAGTSVAAGLLTPQQEEEAQTLATEEGIDIEAARNSILARARDDYKMDFRARGFRAEGGPAEGKEPVAKKTMPLLDMGGKEMDLRAEGGFVPIGRMEKADDVPARLSKNEFVFTADAVRNAGEGDVDKGAEVMYNMMKNLEAGGEVSEESQGLEGARRMFQTSQRLEEVL